MGPRIDAALTASGTLTVSDVDTSDTVNIAVSSVSVGGTGGDGGIDPTVLKAMLSLTGSHSGNAADGTDGSFGWSFDSDTEAFDYLADGETLVLTYTLTATDGNGGSDTQTVEITSTGASLVPVIVIVTVCAADVSLASPLSSVATTSKVSVIVSPSPRKSRSWLTL